MFWLSEVNCNCLFFRVAAIPSHCTTSVRCCTTQPMRRAAPMVSRVSTVSTACGPWWTAARASAMRKPSPVPRRSGRSGRTAAVAPGQSMGNLWDTSILSMDHWVFCRDLVTVREVVSRTPIWRDLWDLFSHFWLPIDLIYRSEKVLMCVFLHRLDWIGLNWIRLHSKISTYNY